MDEEGEHDKYELNQNNAFRMRSQTSNVENSTNNSVYQRIQDKRKLSMAQPSRNRLRVSTSNLSSHIQLDIVQHIKLSEGNSHEDLANSDEEEDPKFGGASHQISNGKI